MSANDTSSSRIWPASLAAFGAGLLFAVGLGVAGMTDPSNIIGFLDVTGEWDPRLMFVMGGAVATGLVLFRLIRRRPAPLVGAKFQLPTRNDIDGRLVTGAALFGIGWGLGGFCPGPALTAAVTGSGHVIAFVGAMLVGMVLQDRVLARLPSMVRAVSSDSSPKPRLN